MVTSVSSGEKYRTDQGFYAIRNGIKSPTNRIETVEIVEFERKPSWIRVRTPSGANYRSVRDIVKSHRLSTVCEESSCPNIGECWNAGTATLMLMGHVCTRACRFCAVDTGNPGGWLDPEEPQNAAQSVKLMNLRYVVLTSVDRDDLSDGGASHYAACVQEIKRINPDTQVEALTPDFAGDRAAVSTVASSGLDVFAQNLETVERLTAKVRDPRAGYQQTLDVLDHAKQVSGVYTKSSLMLGLGETDDEIHTAMCDLRDRNVDFLTLGQYLRPTQNHLSVKRWVTPGEFDQYRDWGLDIGFKEVASGPLVRSSYRADELFRSS